MKPRLRLHPRRHSGDAAAWQSMNRALFSEVAPRYDFVTRALSLGRDAAWKRRLIADLPEQDAPTCADLACGTGDLTRLLAARYPRGRITGIDLTPAMLDRAVARTHDPRIEYREASMQALPFENGSIDVVAGAYALRNAPDLDRALSEIHRVLRPGGTAAFLDFSKPASPLGQAVHHAMLKSWGGFWGLALHANPAVYGYIADSLRRFPDRQALRQVFHRHGFALRTSRLFYGGLLEAITLERTAPTPPATQPTELVTVVVNQTESNRLS